MNFIATILTNARDHLVATPASMFKSFMAAVLIQFSLLSFVSIVLPCGIEALPTLRAIMSSAEYWWGLLSMVGALFLLFDYHVRNWLLGQILGYSAAALSFVALAHDFMFHRPPIHAGGVFAATAVIFIGVLAYDHIRQR